MAPNVKALLHQGLLTMLINPLYKSKLMGQPSFLFNTQMTLIHEFEDVKCILMVFLFVKVRSFIANCVDILLGF